MASYHGPFEVFADQARSALARELAARRGAVRTPSARSARAPHGRPSGELRGRRRLRSRGAPVVLELNPLYAAGYNVPAAHALLVAALGAHLAGRAGYPSSSRERILEDAAVLGGGPIEQSPGVWLLDGIDARLSNSSA